MGAICRNRPFGLGNIGLADLLENYLLCSGSSSGFQWPHIMVYFAIHFMNIS